MTGWEQPFPSRRETVAAVLAGLAAFLLRLAAFNGFENDHFMHLAWAQQLALGAWPGRDFVEPGMPLAIVLSAAAQGIWPGFMSEALLGTGLIGVSAGLACAVTARVARSVPAGVFASLIVLAAYPRLYSYPKVLVPVVTLWLCLRYRPSGSMRSVLPLAGWTVIAFLLRHDLGLMTAAAVAVALLVDGRTAFRGRLWAAGRYLVIGLLLVAPYLAYVQRAEGLVEHVRVGTEFGLAEQHQLLWAGPSIVPGPEELRVVIGSVALSAEGLLFWLFGALTLGLAWWTVRHARPDARTVVTALVIFAVAYRAVILRHPLRARIPDTAAVFGVGAGIGISATGAAVSRLWRTQRVWAMTGGVAAGAVTGAVVVLAAASLWVVANVGDRASQSGLDRGVRGVAIKIRDVVRQAPARSWSPYWPNDDEPAVVDYLRRCTRRDDRVLVTWFAPEYFVFSGRGFAAGHALFLPASFATDRDQALMVDRLARESVPVALINETEYEAFAKAFPRVAQYLAEGYTVRTRFDHNDDTVIGVAFRNDLHPADTLSGARWACGSE